MIYRVILLNKVNRFDTSIKSNKKTKSQPTQIGKVLSGIVNYYIF